MKHGFLKSAATILAGALMLPLAAPSGAQAECGAPARLKFEITQTIARDRLGLTQGFEFRDGKLYESTGLIDNPTQLNLIDLSGRVTTLADLGGKVFGEGLTILNDEIFQLTWKEHQVFVYRPDGKLKRTMKNPRQGWGLSNDGSQLIFTDGGSTLYFADPRTFALGKEVVVRAGSRELRSLNELEWAGGKLYANVFLTKEIVRLDPGTGCVEAIADLSLLWGAMDESERRRLEANAQYVLNGIAHDARAGLFYLTGKRWRYIFVGRFTQAR